MTLKEIWFGLQSDRERRDECLVDPPFWLIGLPLTIPFLDVRDQWAIAGVEVRSFNTVIIIHVLNYRTNDRPHQ